MASKTLTMAAEAVKLFAATLAAISAIFASAWYFVEPRLESWVRGIVEVSLADALEAQPIPASGGPCAVFPVAGHFIKGAEPGQWGEVEWRDVRRLRADCGVPIVTGLLVNGDGFLHDAPLSITGVPVSVGQHSFRYRFQVNSNVSSGSARFRVIVTYPDAIGGAPPAISPWLDFVIKPPLP